MKKDLSIIMVFAMILTCFGAYTVNAKTVSEQITINSLNVTKSGANGETVKGIDWDRAGAVAFPDWNGAYEMAGGSWGNYSIDIPVEGVYEIIVKTGNASGQVGELSFESGDYSGKIAIPNNGDLWGTTVSDKGYIYLKKGNNIVKAKNTGKGYYNLWNFNLNKVNDSFISEVSVRDISVSSRNVTKSGVNGEMVKGVDWDRKGAVAMPDWAGNGGYEMTIGSWGNYSVNIPIAGVYEVTVKVGNKSGYENTMKFVSGEYMAKVKAPNNGDLWGAVSTDKGYIYLNKGENIIKAINGGPAHHIFWDFNLHKVDDSFMDKVEGKEIKKDAHDVTKSGANGESVKGIDWYRSDATEFPQWQGLGYEMQIGSWGRYSVAAVKEGLYEVSIRGGNPNETENTLEFEVNNTYGYVKMGHTKDLWGYDYTMKDYVYLNKGENIITFTNKGPKHVLFIEASFTKVDESKVTKEEIALSKLNKAEKGYQVGKILRENKDLLGIAPDVDFQNVLCPEYSFASLVGSVYKSIDKVKQSYNELKALPLITGNNGVYTVGLLDSINMGDYVMIAIYRGNKLIGLKGDYASLMDIKLDFGSDYVKNENDVVKFMVWNNLDLMVPNEY